MSIIYIDIFFQLSAFGVWPFSLLLSAICVMSYLWLLNVNVSGIRERALLQIQSSERFNIFLYRNWNNCISGFICHIIFWEREAPFAFNKHFFSFYWLKFLILASFLLSFDKTANHSAWSLNFLGFWREMVSKWQYLSICRSEISVFCMLYTKKVFLIPLHKSVIQISSTGHPKVTLFIFCWLFCI